MARPRKHNPPLKDSVRVAHYRKQLKAEGYRNISFLASPEEYEMIEKARSKMGFTTKELFLYYLTGQYLREGRGLYSIGAPLTDDEFLDEFDPNYHQKKVDWDVESGELFIFNDKKAYILASVLLDTEKFPEWFPYHVTCLKDFMTRKQAFEYFCKNRKKLNKSEQIVLLQKADEEYMGYQLEPDHYYYTAFILNEIYPGQMIGWESQKECQTELDEIKAKLKLNG